MYDDSYQAHLLFVNSNLEIINDLNPILGGNLKIGSNLLQFSNSANRLVYNTSGGTNIIDNNLIVLNNNTTYTGVSNYIEVNNAHTGNNPSIKVKSTSNLDPDVSLDIITVGAGNINLNSQQGNIYANSDSLIVSGFVTNSIFRTSSKVGGYNSNTSYILPLTSDTVLFDFANSSNSGTYWANVGAGIEGQKLNLIYNNKSSNSISVLADFGINGIITNTGYSNGLLFDFGIDRTIICTCPVFSNIFLKSSK